MTAAGLPSIEAVGDALFSELGSQVDAAGGSSSQLAHGGISDELLLSLHHLYGKNWAKALQIVDEGGVTCYVGQGSRRKVFQVRGKTAHDQYCVFPSHFCNCQAFFYEVVCRSEAVCCKHQLAARLAAALQRCAVIEVPDIDIAQLLMST